MSRTILIFLLLIFVYFSVGAYLLCTQIPYFLFPDIALTSKTEELKKFRLSDTSKNELLIREYGKSEKQCIIFFPGRHGGIKKYEKTFFKILNDNNFKVFSISYSGQDGAMGEVNNIASLINLITDAIKEISLRCPPKKTIIYGRSLGATIAAYSAEKTKVSGVILESVSPSLSLAIKNHLNSKWYLRPLKILPINIILPKNYELVKPLSLLISMPVSIFQGTNDLETPLSQLQQSWVYSDNVSLHTIKTGVHSNTYIKATNKIVKVAEAMLQQPKS